MNNLAKCISEVIDFLKKSPGESSARWVKILQDIRTDLSSEPKKLEAISLFRQYFGGMGTLNDILFCEYNKNVPPHLSEEDANLIFAKLLDRCFRELKLINGTFFDRLYWRILEFVHKGELSPRIKNSFK
jgi:hypothetical protein